jgi:hypothetical protein
MPSRLQAEEVPARDPAGFENQQPFVSPMAEVQQKRTGIGFINIDSLE